MLRAGLHSDFCLLTPVFQIPKGFRAFGAFPVQYGMVWMDERQPATGFQPDSDSPVRSPAVPPALRAHCAEDSLRRAGTRRTLASHSRTGWPAWPEPHYRLGGL